VLLSISKELAVLNPSAKELSRDWGKRILLSFLTQRNDEKRQPI
jgi:hypothetical protein